MRQKRRGPDKVEKLRILLGAEPGVMRHVASRIVCRFGGGKAAKIHSQELGGTAESPITGEDKLVRGALVQGEDGQRVEQPACGERQRILPLSPTIPLPAAPAKAGSSGEATAGPPHPFPGSIR